MCHVTSALTNQRRVFTACLTQTERVSDDVTCKIGPLDFIQIIFLAKSQFDFRLFEQKFSFLHYVKSLSATLLLLNNCPNTKVVVTVSVKQAGFSRTVLKEMINDLLMVS